MEKSELTLTKSRLGWNEGILSRYNKKGGKIAEFSADEIKTIYIKKTIDVGSINLGIGCAAGIYFSYTEITNNIGKWVGVLVFAFFTLGAILSISQMKIVIETRGESLSIEVDDDTDDAQAFVHSVEKKIKEMKRSF